MSQPPCLETLSLGGDGDEVDAIERVEARLGIRLDDRDASTWLTAGDVFASVLKSLAGSRRPPPDDLWDEFAAALSEETGADPRRVGRQTRLLA